MRLSYCLESCIIVYIFTDSYGDNDRSSAPYPNFGDTALKIMCKRGLGCICANNDSMFDMSLNTIGATDGLAGADALRESRTAELEMFKELLRRDQLDVQAGERRSLIHTSRVITDIGIEAALCIRVIYGALACHSAQRGFQMPRPSEIRGFCTVNTQSFCRV